MFLNDEKYTVDDGVFKDICETTQDAFKARGMDLKIVLSNAFHFLEIPTYFLSPFPSPPLPDSHLLPLPPSSLVLHNLSL